MFDDSDPMIIEALENMKRAFHWDGYKVDAVDALILVRITQAIEYAEKRFKQKLAEDRPST